MVKLLHSSLFSNLIKRHKNLVMVQCLSSLRKRRTSKMCLPTPKTAINHPLPNTQHHTKKEDLPHHTLPKMQFPTFDGENPKIWIDNCENYFTIYTIPERLWVTATSMHLQGNAAMWWQAYKQTHRKISWKDFCSTVQSKFGSDDYKSAVQEMLNLKQTETVEEYTT